MTPRPDELARDTEVERFDRLGRYGEAGVAAAELAGGAAIGSAALSGGKYLSKILPFLNKYVPQDLSLKGISKVSPKLGNFLKSGMASGLTLDSGLDFLRQYAEKDGEEGEAAVDAMADNPLWRFSKKLAKFVDDAFKIGHTLDEVLGMTTSPGNKFQKEIKHVEKSIGMPFRELLRSIYGGEKQHQGAVQPPTRAVQENQQTGLTAPQQQGGQGKGQEALMQTLQMINERLGKR